MCHKPRVRANQDDDDGAEEINVPMRRRSGADVVDEIYLDVEEERFMLFCLRLRRVLAGRHGVSTELVVVWQ